MNVNLHHLELFYYTAKAKGISNAVKIIPYGIRQPAISQQLMKLEEEAGTRLFERKPFALTPAGERLYRFLSRFFDNIESELAMLGEDAPTRFPIACPSIISAKYLPKLIGELTAKFPKLRPNVFEADGVQCLARLNRKEVDAAIAFSVQYKSKSLEITNLAKFPMALVVPVGHRFAQKGFWPKSDFASERWIAIQETSGGTMELLAGLSQFGVTPEFSASTNSIEAALDYVEMGLGIALMAYPPQSLTKDHNVVVLPQEELFGSLYLSIAWQADTNMERSILNYTAATAKRLARQIL